MVAVPSRGRADGGLQRLAPEAAATRELYERHARQIYAFCLGRLRDREEAEDATQSTFLNAFRGLQRGIEPEFEAAWLYKIAENVCLTRHRSSSRRRRVEAPGDLVAMQDVLPSRQHDADELIGLPEALEGMPEQQRRALLLREWQGLSYKEIGDELGLSQSSVETLLFRARRSLAKGLGDEPKKKGIAKRLRASGDAGSLLALVKTLFFSGGAKVVAAVATVAATSIVAATPSVRHAVEHTIVPVHHRAPALPAPAPASARVRLQTAPAAIVVVPRTRGGTGAAPAHHVSSTHPSAHVPTSPAPVAPAAPAVESAAAPAAQPASQPAVQPAVAPAAVTPTVAAPPADTPTPPTKPAERTASSPKPATPPGQAKKDATDATSPAADPPAVPPADTSAPPTNASDHAAPQAKAEQPADPSSKPATPPGQAKQDATAAVSPAADPPVAPPAVGGPPGQAKQLQDAAPAPATPPAAAQAQDAAGSAANGLGYGKGGKKK